MSKAQKAQYSYAGGSEDDGDEGDGPRDAERFPRLPGESRRDFMCRTGDA